MKQCFVCGSIRVCEHREIELLPRRMRMTAAQLFHGFPTGEQVGLSIKQRAWSAVAKAINSGRLIRPEACEICGLKCCPDARHDDYYEPLKVVWLCRGCHRLLDPDVENDGNLGCG